MYKFHVDDPITFQDGGQLNYRVGDYVNTTAHTARCQTLDDGPVRWTADGVLSELVQTAMKLCLERNRPFESVRWRQLNVLPRKALSRADRRSRPTSQAVQKTHN